MLCDFQWKAERNWSNERPDWKAFEAVKGPNIMDSYLHQGLSLLVRMFVTKDHSSLIQEDVVAEEISLSKPFLKETKTSSLPRLKSEVLSR